MLSNWPVVHNGGNPWKGPGPFEKFAAWAEAAGRERFGLRGTRIGREDSLLVRFARGVALVPDSSPSEAVLRIDDFVERSVRMSALAGVPDLTVLFASLGRVVDAGPKVFRPTARHCELLERVKVTSTAAEILLPFPVCVVEFPQDYYYAADRSAPSPDDGVAVRPEFVVVVQENGALMANLVMAKPQGGSSRLIHHLLVGGSTVEAVHSRNADADPQLGRVAPFINAALNFLKQAAGGHRLVGPANPAQARHLRERIKRAKKERQTDKLNALRKLLRRMPDILELSQEISLPDGDTPPADPNPEADGPPKITHWRKGHMRRVRCGPGWSEWKLTHIKSVLVNARLLRD